MSSLAHRYAPLLLFGVTYVLSCVVGATLMLGDVGSFNALYEYFSGTPVPDLHGERLAVTLTLLLVAPLVFAAGYTGGLRIPLGRAPASLERRLTRPDLSPPRWLPYAVFTLLAAAAVISLARAGAFADVDSWLDYGAWIRARSNVFASMGYLSFVNIYLAVPLAAAWVLVERSGRRLLSVGGVTRILPAGIAVLLELFLYMRKAAMVAVLIVLFAFVLDAARRGRRVRMPLAAGIGAITLLYFAAVVAPVYSEAAQTIDQALAAEPQVPPTPAGQRRDEARLAELGAELQLDDRRKTIVLYSLISPLTRTSAPALYYPIVYPAQHEFHGIDLGLDIVGYGVMPNDNLVVWHYMSPTLPGSTAAPFHFVLYSQVGLTGALLASVIAGVLLALLWRAVTAPWLDRTWASLLGAMVMLLSVYLAIDSHRNSTLVSYGVGWGFLFVAAAVLLTTRVNALLPPGASRSRSTPAVAARRNH